MDKPRVVLADLDQNYISALQNKFIKELFDRIDLEVITDQNYFDVLFSKNQKIDILVIDEKLYSAALHKHDISSIFVLMEDIHPGETRELTHFRILKYTSIKEIYNEIVGNSMGALDIAEEEKGPEIIVVTSAGGGLGKTSVSLALSASLAKNYRRVLYINAGNIQAFQYLMDNHEKIQATEVYAQFSHPTENLYDGVKYVIKTEEFSYLPEFKTSLMSLGISFSAYQTFAESAKQSKDYDFIVIDLESSLDEYKASLLSSADKVIFLLGQSIGSVMTANAYLTSMNMSDPDKYLFVCNRFEKNDYNALINVEINKSFNVSDYIDEIHSKTMLEYDAFSLEPGIKKMTNWII